MNIKIINVLPHPPAYELYFREPRFKINWETSDGQWVGIEGNDWPNLIGEEVLKLTNEFDYEVWQPDLRAKKVYIHKFNSRLKHILFPAYEQKIIFGFKLKRQISSGLMLERLEEISSKNLILHLSSLSYYINQKIIQKFYNVPKVIQFHSIISTPYIEMIKFRRNILANVIYFKLHTELKKNNKILFVYNNSKRKDSLLNYSPLGIERIFMGCDFDYWCPNNKIYAKETLGINFNTKVFSMASRFNSLKQIDKVIEIFTIIDRSSKYDFKLIIAGHGEREYEYYLRKISSELLKKGKLIFPGHLNNERMRNVYQASDLFISASTSEGGPTSIVKAIACGTPVMCTRVGGADDLLVQQNAGILVSNYEYNEWYRTLYDFFKGKLILKLANREKAKEILHWPNIAKKWINIYKKLKNNE